MDEEMTQHEDERANNVRTTQHNDEKTRGWMTRRLKMKELRASDEAFEVLTRGRMTRRRLTRRRHSIMTRRRMTRGREQMTR